MRFICDESNRRSLCDGIIQDVLHYRLEYPNKLNNALVVDSQQRLVIRFTLKDLDYGKLHKVQQVFVQLVNKDSGIEATYVCLSDSSRNYKLSIVSSRIVQVLSQICSD